MIFRYKTAVIESDIIFIYFTCAFRIVKGGEKTHFINA